MPNHSSHDFPMPPADARVSGSRSDRRHERMRGRARVLVIAACCLVLGPGAGFVAAQADAAGPPGADSKRGVPISLDEAVLRVQKSTGGRILEAKPAPGQAAPAYQIKVLLPDGRLRILHIDATTGRGLPDQGP